VCSDRYPSIHNWDMQIFLRLATVPRVTRDCLIPLEGFSLKFRKVIGFALTTLHEWLKKTRATFTSNDKYCKTKTNREYLHLLSRPLRKLHVITWSFDWFIVLSVSFVIGQNDYFGLGFTTLN